jgi:hypothetical protein
MEWLMLHAFALSAVLALIALPSLASADPAAKKRCTELVAFFDRWGTTRTGHSDGARNHARIGAWVDCQRGDYRAGIGQMESLLERKKFEVPVQVGEAPLYEPL